MNNYQDYASFENDRYVLSDSESSGNIQISLNDCILCSIYGKTICTFPCWNNFDENKLPGAVILDGQIKSTMYFCENLEKDVYSGIVFDKGKSFILRTARDLLIVNPFIIDCFGRPVTNREWLLELDSLDSEVLLPEKWKGHADIIKKFERKKIAEQRDLFAALAD